VQLRQLLQQRHRSAAVQWCWRVKLRLLLDCLLQVWLQQARDCRQQLAALQKHLLPVTAAASNHAWQRVWQPPAAVRAGQGHGGAAAATQLLLWRQQVMQAAHDVQQLPQLQLGPGRIHNGRQRGPVCRLAWQQQQLLLLLLLLILLLLGPSPCCLPRGRCLQRTRQRQVPGFERRVRTTWTAACRAPASVPHPATPVTRLSPAAATRPPAGWVLAGRLG
jgi:hypothetical protein